MSLRACGGAILLLLALGCDKLRSVPGFEPAPVPPPRSPPIAMGPWLLDPLPGQVTVVWTTLEPSVGRVWYGTREPDRLATEEGQPVTDHRVLLPSLQPETQYKYRVEGGQETAWFTSAPKPGSEGPIQVLVHGANGGGSGDHALVARAAAAERAQIALHTGDMVTSAREDSLWKIWFQEERDLLAHVPLVATVGGQEIRDGGAAFGRFFQHRGRPPYWSFDYGPVHIVSLDSYETAAGATPDRPGMSEVQQAWFEEDVRTVPKDRHVWVLVHHGPFAHPAEARREPEGAESVRESILRAHLLHPIEAVFGGQESFYERGEIAGIRYFVIGGGGAPLAEPDASAEGVKVAARALSFAVVQVCGCHSAGRVKDILGRVIDAFTLSECDTPCSVPGWAASVSAASAVSAAPPGAERSGKSKRRRKGKRRRGSSDDTVSARESRSR